jgi:putative transcriptional regulator
VSPVNGSRIRELRDERGYSQRELARRAGVRQPSLSAIETGQAKRVDVAMLEQIAKALEVELSDLLERKRGK